MIRWQLVRAFERGARRNHIPNIELQRYICEVFHGMEDSINLSEAAIFPNGSSKTKGKSVVQPTDVTFSGLACIHVY